MQHRSNLALKRNEDSPKYHKYALCDTALKNNSESRHCPSQISHPMRMGTFPHISLILFN